MLKAILITPSQLPRLIETDAELGSLQALVGGYIEAVRISKDVVAYVDEEAKLKANPPPINAIATTIAISSGAIAEGDCVRGPMVILGALDAGGRNDGDEHDVPGWLAAALVPEGA